MSSPTSLTSLLASSHLSMSQPASLASSLLKDGRGSCPLSASRPCPSPAKRTRSSRLALSLAMALLLAVIIVTHHIRSHLHISAHPMSVDLYYITMKCSLCFDSNVYSSPCMLYMYSFSSVISVELLHACNVWKSHCSSLISVEVLHVCNLCKIHCRSVISIKSIMLAMYVSHCMIACFHF